MVGEEEALREVVAGLHHSEVTVLAQAVLEPEGPVPEECVARRETADNGEGHVKNSNPTKDSSPRTLL